MRFRQKILNEIADHITRLELQRCPICEGDAGLSASPYRGSLEQELADEENLEPPD